MQVRDLIAELQRMDPLSEVKTGVQRRLLNCPHCMAKVEIDGTRIVDRVRPSTTRCEVILEVV